MGYGKTQKPKRKSFFSEYKNSGQYTFTWPQGIDKLIVKCWGGTGGDAASGLMHKGGSGKQGQYTTAALARPESGVSILVIGAGGQGGKPLTNGTDGQETRFDTLVAHGGVGGKRNEVGEGGRLNESGKNGQDGRIQING